MTVLFANPLNHQLAGRLKQAALAIVELDKVGIAVTAAIINPEKNPWLYLVDPPAESSPIVRQDKRHGYYAGCDLSWWDPGAIVEVKA